VRENHVIDDEARPVSHIANDAQGMHLRAGLAMLVNNNNRPVQSKAEIDRLTVGYDDKPRFFIDKLAQGVAMIAAAFYPKDVILRLSDFKTNEYANLIGGRKYEPQEENPMIGFRGASRYYNPRYQDGFALECRAMKKVRDKMGLKNLKLMIPFCRTIEEGKLVQAEMERHGLKRGDDSLDIYVMCEIPSNVILAEEFAEIFDGFSIGNLPNSWSTPNCSEKDTGSDGFNSRRKKGSRIRGCVGRTF
jgi:pyruvate,water dikinase